MQSDVQCIVNETSKYETFAQCFIKLNNNTFSNPLPNALSVKSYLLSERPVHVPVLPQRKSS